MEYLIIFLIGVAVGIVLDRKQTSKVQKVIDFFNKWKK
jgi:uncharacterized membrane protein